MPIKSPAFDENKIIQLYLGRAENTAKLKQVILFKLYKQTNRQAVRLIQKLTRKAPIAPQSTC